MTTAFTTAAIYLQHAGYLPTDTGREVQILNNQLTLWVPEVCDLIEKYIDRVIAAATYTDEYYSGNGTSILPLRQWPVTSLGPIYEDDAGYYGTPGGSFASTASTTTSAGGTLPVTTLSLTDTTDFDDAGSVGVMNSAGQMVKVGYTGKTATTLTGCSGGQGAFASGAAVIQAGSLLYEGTNYALRNQADGSGLVERINDVWPDLSVRRYGQLSSQQKDDPGNLKVTYTAGYTTIPSQLTLAANLVITEIRWLARFNRMVQSESYEERSVSFFIPWRTGDLLEPVKPLLSKFKKWSVG